MFVACSYQRKSLLDVRLHGNLCTELVSRNPPSWKLVLLSQQRSCFQKPTTSYPWTRLFNTQGWFVSKNRISAATCLPIRFLETSTCHMTYPGCNEEVDGGVSGGRVMHFSKYHTPVVNSPLRKLRNTGGSAKW
jgi:hypothetical protein